MLIVSYSSSDNGRDLDVGITEKWQLSLQKIVQERQKKKMMTKVWIFGGKLVLFGFIQSLLAGTATSWKFEQNLAKIQG